MERKYQERKVDSIQRNEVLKIVSENRNVYPGLENACEQSPNELHINTKNIQKKTNFSKNACISNTDLKMLEMKSEPTDVNNDTPHVASIINKEHKMLDTPVHFESINIKTEHDTDSEIEDVETSTRFPGDEERNYKIQSEQTVKFTEVKNINSVNIASSSSKYENKIINTSYHDNTHLNNVETVFVNTKCTQDNTYFKTEPPEVLNYDCSIDRLKTENIDLQKNITVVDINNILTGM